MATVPSSQRIHHIHGRYNPLKRAILVANKHGFIASDAGMNSPYIRSGVSFDKNYKLSDLRPDPDAILGPQNRAVKSVSSPAGQGEGAVGKAKGLNGRIAGKSKRSSLLAKLKSRKFDPVGKNRLASEKNLEDDEDDESIDDNNENEPKPQTGKSKPMGAEDNSPAMMRRAMLIAHRSHKPNRPGKGSENAISRWGYMAQQFLH